MIDSMPIFVSNILVSLRRNKPFSKGYIIYFNNQDNYKLYPEYKSRLTVT